MEYITNIPEVFVPIFACTNVFLTCKLLLQYSPSSYIVGNSVSKLRDILPKIHLYIPPGEDSTVSSNLLKCNLLLVVNRTCSEYILCTPQKLLPLIVEIIGRWKCKDVVQIYPYTSPSSLVYYGIVGYNYLCFNTEIQKKECVPFICDSGMLCNKKGYTSEELKAICDTLGLDTKYGKKDMVRCIRLYMKKYFIIDIESIEKISKGFRCDKYNHYDLKWIAQEHNISYNRDTKVLANNILKHIG